MSNLTELQKNKLGGFEAQRQMIRRIIQEAKDELLVWTANVKEVKDEYFKLRGDYLKELEAIKLEVSNYQDEKRISSNELEVSRNDFKRSVVDATTKLDAREAKVSELESNFNKTIEEKNNIITQLINNINSKTTALTSIENTIAQTMSELVALNASIVTSKSELESITKKLADAKSEEAVYIPKLQEYIKLQEEKLNALLLQNEEEAKKISEAKEGLVIRESIIDTKVSNMLVIYHRTKKAWEKLYPGQNIDNVIRI